MARELIVRTKSETGDEALRADLIELIETVIIYKLPRFTREEIRTMLQVHDFRGTRVFQEGVEEGEEKGIAIAIVKMAAKKMSVAEIAAILELDAAFVQQVVEAAALQPGGNSGHVSRT